MTKTKTTQPKKDEKKKTEDVQKQEKKQIDETKKKQPVSQKKARSKRYMTARSQVDKTKKYPLSQALALVKDTSYAKFDASIEAHLVVKQTGASATIQYPHKTGKTVKVAIVNNEVIENIKNSNIDFDVLLAQPEDMKKIAKYARILGPQGLMPNPKNNTITNDPEAKKKEIESGKRLIKTERKAPLIHEIVGKISMDVKELEENVNTLLNAFKNKVIKCTLAASMGPGIKVKIEK